MTNSFTEHRPLAFSIAYNMLGSVSEAEDIVQETFARLLESSSPITSPKAYIAKTATNLSIDHFRSARVRRETYFGEWLPEPLVSDPGPEAHVEEKEELSLATLALLENLTPTERAVFVLREVLEFDYSEISTFVNKSPENCRQLFARARKHIRDNKPRFDVPRAEKQKLAEQFFHMFRTGDTTELISMLTKDIVFHGDGGGNGLGLHKPLAGMTQVARFVAGLVRQVERWNVRFEPATVNGQPGAKFFMQDGALIYVMALDIADGHIVGIRSIINSAKLEHLGKVADIPALLAAGPPKK
ncbi:MAG: RNA polymerase sigma-70 factor [Corynebacteriales bacterium]|nr:RNA polymerase sigma-70 factor [Mycobacteriales bacterium]